MTNVIAGGTTGFILGALVNGGVQAACGAAAGATGALILDASGYKDYSVEEATQMGALGSAIAGATVGGIYGAVVGCAAGINDKSDENSNNEFWEQAVNYVGTQTVGGLIGWAVMNNNSATLMSLAKTAAALATGAAVTFCPGSLIIQCCTFPIIVAGAACVFDAVNGIDENAEPAEPEATSPGMNV